MVSRMIWPAVAGALTSIASPGRAAGSVEVIVTGVRVASGNVTAQVCTEAEFLKPCHYSASALAKASSTTVVVRDVPPGRYAVVAYHDKNANGKADTNFLGLPTEDVGFSRDALKGLTRPKFSDAAFDHGNDDQRITLKLNKF